MSEANNPMTPAEIAAFLRRFNDWRRGNIEDQPMPHPREIGEVIDAAILALESVDVEAGNGALAIRAVDYLGRVDALVREIEARAPFRPKGLWRDGPSATHDIEAERKRFEAWISSPPFERSIERIPDDAHHAWPGSYRPLDVDLAWQAWQAATKVGSQSCSPEG